MKTYLVLRFSAMGDVLLTLPVLAAAIEQNQGIKFVVLTRPKFTVFFDGYPQIEALGVDLEGEFKSPFALWGLVRKLKKSYRFEAVLDLHQVIRTSILKFFLFPISIFTIDKGRGEKKALTRKEDKNRSQLTHTTERYAQVLRKAGLSVDLNKTKGKTLFRNLPDLPFEKNKTWIGIAPFAQHEGKMWPIDKVEQVLSIISQNKNTEVLLFGGGKKEEAMLNELAQKYPNVKSLAGKFSLKQELSIIGKLAVMLCMDSSNMHLAALAGTPTISIWGATHSFAGFGPFGQNQDGFMEISPDELTCRPCSVYGNKPCFRGDYACLTQIEAIEIAQKIISYC